MKDQNNITEALSSDEKWNRALDLFIESVYKPDTALRQCAHNQQCYDELMNMRKMVIKYLSTLRK
jgi:hypothetical protein